MGLKEDAKKIFTEAVGRSIAEQIEKFDDPNRYPNDFLNECEYFMSQILGKDAAKRLLEPLREKYLKPKKTSYRRV